MRIVGGVLVGLLGLAPGVTGAPSDLERRVREEVSRFHGVMGVVARNLDTGERVAVDGTARFPTASLIKVAVMVEVFHRIADGSLRRDQTVTLSDADRAGDETVPLNVLHAGSVLTVSDLLRLMIAWSDNTATNLLVRLAETERIDRRMESYGLPNTRIFRPTFRDGKADVFPELEHEFGLGMTTPAEAARLFELIADGKVVDRASSEEMLAILALQQDRAMIPRRLPFERDRLFVANKTGWDEEKLADPHGFRGDVRADAAYVKGPRGRYVLAILARRIRDKSPGVDNEALVTGARISRMIYDAFAGPPGPSRR
ncbi:MAG TPA: serine hydrolase [Thermoanaerobaculia bacterium]